MDFSKTLTQCDDNGTRVCTTVVTTIALCTSCSQAKNQGGRIYFAFFFLVH